MLIGRASSTIVQVSLLLEREVGKNSTAMLSIKKSVGVKLRSPLHAGNEACKQGDLFKF